MTVNEKIGALRAAMKAAGANLYYVPCSDEHMSEYLPDHWDSVTWLTGYTGQSATFIVTETESALWVDGRNFVQAARQIEGSEIILQRMGQPGVPTVAEYLADKLPMNGVLALDGSVTSDANMALYKKAFAKKNVTIQSIDLVSPLWVEGRPAVPASEVYLLEEKYTGFSAKEKLAMVRKALAEKEADGVLLCALDSIIWALNIRGNDINYNPYVLSYLFVGKNDATLFVNTACVPADVQANLAANGVAVQPYDAVAGFVKNYKESCTLLVDAARTGYALAEAIRGNSAFTVLAGTDPVQALKGTKNATEIACLKNCHAKDGVAMIRFQMMLEKKMAANETVTELDVDNWLRELRAAQPLNKGESFGTIAAYGPNAAMMHYHATEDNYTTLQKRGFLLVDSGAQYLDGTTDITRTYTVGPLTEEEKVQYTNVLKCHIDLAKLTFMRGCTGGNLDIIARYHLWQQGLDYRCGTGHGVGFLGGVHEGPQSLRVTNNEKFVPGMTITDEPGIYEEGIVGIRIENELLCVERMTTEYGTFLGFEAITYCPIDTTPVLVNMLDDAELAWLNAFHKACYETLAPLVTEEEKEWLAAKTAPLAR